MATKIKTTPEALQVALAASYEQLNQFDARLNALQQAYHTAANRPNRRAAVLGIWKIKRVLRRALKRLAK